MGVKYEKENGNLFVDIFYFFECVTNDE